MMKMKMMKIVKTIKMMKLSKKILMHQSIKFMQNLQNFNFLFSFFLEMSALITSFISIIIDSEFHFQAFFDFSYKERCDSLLEIT